MAPRLHRAPIRNRGRFTKSEHGLTDDVKSINPLKKKQSSKIKYNTTAQSSQRTTAENEALPECRVILRRCDETKSRSKERSPTCTLSPYNCDNKRALTSSVNSSVQKKQHGSQTFCQSTITHTQTLTIKKHFKCHFCSYSSIDRSNLVRHICIHTREKPYACHICEYKCAVRTSLVCHIQTHTREKPYACHICEYKCTQNAHLRSHLLTHTREKPFQCHLCPFKCTQKRTLIVHFRKHTKEKPHECNFCSYVCANSGNLSQHIQKHTRQKPHKCHLCPYACAQKGSLVAHLRRHHTKENP